MYRKRILSLLVVLALAGCTTATQSTVPTKTPSSIAGVEQGQGQKLQISTFTLQKATPSISSQPSASPSAKPSASPVASTICRRSGSFGTGDNIHAKACNFTVLADKTCKVFPTNPIGVLYDDVVSGGGCIQVNTTDCSYKFTTCPNPQQTSGIGQCMWMQVKYEAVLDYIVVSEHARADSCP